MKTKKAYCPNCKTKDLKLRIFDVNSQADVCFCPHCMSSFKPSEVINAYEAFIKKKISHANAILFSAIDFEKAYLMFAEVLEIDSSNVDALLGRLLSLIYMSTLRRHRFQDFMTLLDEERNIFRRIDNIPAYISFIYRSLNAINEFYNNSLNKLSYRSFFYDFACVELFVLNLLKLIDTALTLQKELKFIIQKSNKEHRVYEVNIKCEAIISLLQDCLNGEFKTLDGLTFSYAFKVHLGKPLFIKKNNQKSIDLKKNKIFTLDSDEAKGPKKYINDSVYPNNLLAHLAKRISLPLLIGFGTILLIIIPFAFLFSKYLNIFIIVSSVVVVFSIALLTIYLISLSKLRKRHRLVS